MIANDKVTLIPLDMAILRPFWGKLAESVGSIGERCRQSGEKELNSFLVS